MHPLGVACGDSCLLDPGDCADGGHHAALRRGDGWEQLHERGGGAHRSAARHLRMGTQPQAHLTRAERRRDGEAAAAERGLVAQATTLSARAAATPAEAEFSRPVQAGQPALSLAPQAGGGSQRARFGSRRMREALLVASASNDVAPHCVMPPPYFPPL